MDTLHKMRLPFHKERRYKLDRTLDGEYDVASPYSTDYNCIAFAIGDQARWWEPPTHFNYKTYWYKEVKGEISFDIFLEMFREYGEFAECKFRKNNFKKFQYIAIYYDENSPPFGHVAFQDEDGKWKSKLSEDEDIEHLTPQVLEAAYGSIVKYMRRKRNGKNGYLMRLMSKLSYFWT